MLESSASDHGLPRPGWRRLGGVVLVALALRLLFFSGFVHGDDAAYIPRAVQVSEGRFDIGSDHWACRLGVYFPCAAMFAVFGKHLAWVVAAPLVWSLVSVVLAYQLATTAYGQTAPALLAAVLTAVFPMDVIFSTTLLPEMGIEALSAAALLAYLVADKSPRPRWYLTAGLLLGLAYTHRVTALFALLPFGAVVLYRRRIRRGDMLAGTGLLIVVALETVFLWSCTGDVAYRLKAIKSEASATPQEITTPTNPNPRPGGEAFSPLISLATEEEYGLYYYLVLPAAVALAFRRDRPSYPILLFFAVTALYTLYGPVGLTTYRHLRPWPRYMSIVTVPAVVLLARWLIIGWTPRWRTLVIAVLIASSLACIYLDNGRTTRSLGRGLLTWYQHAAGRTMIMDEHAFQCLYIANGLRIPAGVEICQEPAAPRARALSPALVIHQPPAPGESSACEEHLPACLLVMFDLKVEARQPRGAIPPHWHELGRIERAQRWFARPLRAWGGVYTTLADKLSPRDYLVIYDVRPEESRRSSP